MTAIAFENVTKKYGAVTALDGVSIDVARGEMFGVIGPDGAGKTTAIRVACGLAHSRRRPRVRARPRSPPGASRGDPRDRVSLAEIQPVWRPHDRRERRVLCRDSRDGPVSRRARPPARDDSADAVPGAPRRSAVGRHEAEAGARLHARARTGGVAARRTDHGRRSCVAARVLEAPVRVPGRRAHHRDDDAVPRRGRTLCARGVAARGACAGD